MPYLHNINFSSLVKVTPFYIFPIFPLLSEATSIYLESKRIAVWGELIQAETQIVSQSQDEGKGFL